MSDLIRLNLIPSKPCSSPTLIASRPLSHYAFGFSFTLSVFLTQRQIIRYFLRFIIITGTLYLLLHSIIICQSYYCVLSALEIGSATETAIEQSRVSTAGQETIINYFNLLLKVLGARVFTFPITRILFIQGSVELQVGCR